MSDNEERCGAQDKRNGYTCTRPSGHEDAHISRKGYKWNDRDKVRAKSKAKASKPAAAKAEERESHAVEIESDAAPSAGDIVEIQWDPRTTKRAVFVKWRKSGSAVVRIERVNAKGEPIGDFGTDRDIYGAGVLRVLERRATAPADATSIARARSRFVR